MLSLDQVRDEILELMNSCGADPEKAQAGIQEIFYSLMCADQPLYLIYAEESPLISPASSDTKKSVRVPTVGFPNPSSYNETFS